MHIPLIVSVRDYGYACAIRTLLRGDQQCDGPAFGKCIHCATQSYGFAKAVVTVPSVLLGRKLLRRRINGVHAISTFVRTFTRSHLMTPERSTIVEAIIPSFLEPVDRGTSDDADSEVFIQSLPSEPYILFVGALQAHKGLLILLEAYRMLTSPPPLVLIGTAWPSTPRLLPLNVTMLHNVPHPLVMVAWERCLFGVAPSIWPEPLGAVVFEAMSSGKAIIGTWPGGHADTIIDGETGFLIPAGDVGALANAMEHLINNPELRDRLGRAGQSRAVRYTSHFVVPQIEAFYLQVAQSNVETVLSKASE
jgi:glycosyltransferase involved in cell wall biosynthesis